ALERKKEKVEMLSSFLSKHGVEPNDINPIIEEKGSSAIKQKVKLDGILARPQISFDDLMGYEGLSDFVFDNNISREEWEQIEIRIKYQGYIDKERESAEKLSRLADIKIPSGFDYSKLKSLSYEGCEKLSKVKPETIDQAKKISGVTPSDISVLLVYMGR